MYTYWTSFQLGWRPRKLFQHLEEKPNVNHCPGGYTGAAGLVIFGNQLWLFLFSSPTASSDLRLVQWEHSHQCFLTNSAYKHERTKTLKNSSQLSTPTSCCSVGIQNLLTQLKSILWRIKIKSWLIPLLAFPPPPPTSAFLGQTGCGAKWRYQNVRRNDSSCSWMFSLEAGNETNRRNSSCSVTNSANLERSRSFRSLWTDPDASFQIFSLYTSAKQVGNIPCSLHPATFLPILPRPPRGCAASASPRGARPGLRDSAARGALPSLPRACDTALVAFASLLENQQFKLNGWTTVRPPRTTPEGELGGWCF